MLAQMQGPVTPLPTPATVPHDSRQQRVGAWAGAPQAYLGWSCSAGSERNEGRGSGSHDATGTCHGPWRSRPHGGWVAVGGWARRAGGERGRRCVRKDLTSSVTI